MYKCDTLATVYLFNDDCIISVDDSMESDIYKTKFITVVILHKNAHFNFILNIY